MKILFVMRTTVYVRNFESTLRLLAQRGHDVHVAAEIYQLLDKADLITRLAADHPQIHHVVPPKGPIDGWTLLGEDLRRSVNYLRYLRPEYREAPKLRRRAVSYAPSFILDATRSRLMRTAPVLALAGRMLRTLDDALPINTVVFDFVREQNPDLLIVTPLVEPSAPQSQYLRAARALGIRTALCVYSWDNLTNKGLIQDPLALVTVWNEPMKREAVELHHVPPDRVTVTGAPNYDHWFDWKPRWTRDEFCRRVGLPADRPYVLYLCSSKFIAPQEVAFVRRWIEQIRTASPLLAATGVLIRPHPQWARPWRTADVGDLPAVSIWPLEGANPVDADSRAEYFDSIFHSAGVVGINTSAQIESAIVGRPVFTWLTPEFRETQEGTLHFHHLRHVQGGVLNVAETLEEHVAQLERVVTPGGADAARCRPFVEAFVRPHGIDVPATPRLVDAIERLLAQPRPRPEPPPWYAGLVRSWLERFTAPLVREEERLIRKEAQRVERLADSEARDTQRAQEVVAQVRVRGADPAQAGHVAATYEDVRMRVERMKTAAGPAADLAELAPLRHATPDMLLELRRYGALVGGSNPADYVDVPDAAKRQLRSHLRRLVQEAGDGLRVRESPAFGQFGLPRGDGVHTADTLMYFEILTALKFGAALPDVRKPPRRPIVWDATRDWGGFAYQFKTLFPRVTYVISAHPDLFLLSATYLRLQFPQAVVRFFGDGPADRLWTELETVDFVFLPQTLPPGAQPPYVTLGLDILGLEHLPPAQIEQHVRAVFDGGATFFYSALPISGAAGSAGLRSALERCYWLHELPVPQFDKRESLKRWSPTDRDDPRRVRRRHIMGWRKRCL